LANGCPQVHHAGRQILLPLERDPLLRIQRREVLEKQLLARLVGRFEVDRLDLDQREVPLAFLGRTDLAGYRVARLEIELPDLRQRLNAHVLQIGDVETLAGAPRRRGLLRLWSGFRLFGRKAVGGSGEGVGCGRSVPRPRRSMALMSAWHEGSRTSLWRLSCGGLATRRIQRGVMAAQSIGFEV